ncbi:uncharacterized protein LOC111692276 [Anoplophora glabripennis]|uniref:uncharacterized protein LOC111692276 n=1 Tax=Anoplophora glabripennis TaxID=217634 RepID=UPI000C776A5E|nr:uncharacterized protein LOC111692276 [Anoplophora glabripennis]
MNNLDNERNESIPAEIEEAASRATLELLPAKSKEQYEIAYRRFSEWCNIKKVPGKCNESVLLAYFEEKAKIWKSSTLWSNYSMIKTMLKIKQDQDISKHYKLIAFLKRKGEGYQAKKSKVLTKTHIDKFLTEAEDEKYLMMKVAAIVGVFGACRREELCQMTIDNIEYLGTSVVVTIPDTKTKVPRTFSVVGEFYLNFFRKYMALRPPNADHRRLFLKYMKNKCVKNPVGINMFGKMPADIAEFLNLPNPQLYTGHCFRRSSATLLADSGANLTTIKRHGGWKSSTVAEGYIENSLEQKKEIACQILPTAATTSKTTSTTSSISTENRCVTHVDSKTNLSMMTPQGITISNCSNFTINVNSNN